MGRRVVAPQESLLVGVKTRAFCLCLSSTMAVDSSVDAFLTTDYHGIDLQGLDNHPAIVARLNALRDSKRNALAARERAYSAPAGWQQREAHKRADEAVERARESVQRLRETVAALSARLRLRRFG